MNSIEKNFHHPFIPYDIQRQFMQALYDCIEGGKVGIFESPTGTLLDPYKWTADSEPEWMLEYSRREKTRFIREKREQLEDRLAKIRADEERQRKQFVDGNHTSKRRKLTAGNDASEQGS
ncbi:DEAD_2 protein [Histoplasma capsulatum H143]|uniref:DEAD_2 protein n=1 Tax=Ajellomyces capsulatus (strain H143) TaxID=544712 RepID=C6H906_AJECH|nr:DEAD_2 protein [Histoplasma capsulatum H143]